ncbi:MAG: helix-turn-helix transcriptional regulator [Clostridium sp.]|mgnify:CR=1 FL=1
MNKITKARKEKGLSQEKLAKLIDVSYKTIYRIEKNENTDVRTAIKIAKILEKTVEELFEEK